MNLENHFFCQRGLNILGRIAYIAEGEIPRQNDCYG